MNVGGACIIAALAITFIAGRRLGRQDRVQTRNAVFRAGWHAACEDFTLSLDQQNPGQETGWMVMPYEQYCGQVEAAQEGWQ